MRPISRPQRPGCVATLALLAFAIVPAVVVGGVGLGLLFLQADVTGKIVGFILAAIAIPSLVGFVYVWFQARSRAK